MTKYKYHVSLTIDIVADSPEERAEKVRIMESTLDSYVAPQFIQRVRRGLDWAEAIEELGLEDYRKEEKTS